MKGREECVNYIHCCLTWCIVSQKDHPRKLSKACFFPSSHLIRRELSTVRGQQMDIPVSAYVIRGWVTVTISINVRCNRRFSAAETVLQYGEVRRKRDELEDLILLYRVYTLLLTVPQLDRRIKSLTGSGRGLGALFRIWAISGQLSTFTQKPDRLSGVTHGAYSGEVNWLRDTLVAIQSLIELCDHRSNWHTVESDCLVHL